MLENDFRLGEWLIQPSRNRIKGADRASTVKLKSMAVLLRLAEADGKVVEKRALLDAVWGDAVVTEDVLTQCIVELRKAFGDSAANPEVIETIRRVGFRLIPPAQFVGSATARVASDPAGVRPDAIAPEVSRTAPWLGRRHLIVIVAALLMIGAVISISYLTDPPGPDASDSEQSFQPPAQSVAVMPFADLTPQADHEWLGDGMAEALLHALTQHSGLQVTARTSAFAFKGQDIDAREIGRLLDVRTVLEGSVQRTADTLRITAQLVETEAGRHLFSLRYDRPADDIFEIQDEIAAAVTAELLESLDQVQPAVATEARTRSLSAYDDYLLGRFHLHKRTGDSIQDSIDYFESAIAADPGFALAYSGLADALAVLPDYSDVSRADVIGPAREAVQRALALAPDLAEAHASLGLLYYIEMNEEMADAAFERALALNPNYVMAYVWHGVSLNARMRYRDALVSFRRALALDPLAPAVTSNVANVQVLLGQYDEAVAGFARTLELSPGHVNAAFNLATTHHERGALDEAARWYDRTLELGWRSSLTLREPALLYAELGDDDAADYWLAAAEAAGNGAFTWYGRKLVLMTRGDTDALYAGARANLERQSEDAFAVADLGLAEAYRERCEPAVTLYERLPRDAEHPTTMFNFWDIGYGYSHAVHLLHCYQQLGAATELVALRREIDTYLARLAGGGYAKHGQDYVRAQIAAISDDRDMALAHLQRAVGKGWSNYRRARHDPILSVLSEEPRFVALMDEVESRVAQIRSRMTATIEERGGQDRSRADRLRPGRNEESLREKVGEPTPDGGGM